MGDITWLIFTVLSWKLLCKEWPSIHASSEHIYISFHLWCLRGQMNGCGLFCGVLGRMLNHLYVSPFGSCIWSDLLRLWIDLRSTIVHLLSTQLEKCSIQRRDPPWNNEAEKEWGQIESFKITDLLMLERDCILSTRNQHWRFQMLTDKSHSELLLCAWGQHKAIQGLFMTYSFIRTF